MKKPCAIIANHPELAEISAEIDAINSSAIERIETLQAKAFAIVSECLEKTKPLWGRTESWLRDHGHLPDDYSKEKYTSNIKQGVLYLEKSDDRSNAIDLSNAIAKAIKKAAAAE